MDSLGNVIPPKSKRSSLSLRTPPPDRELANGYAFDLDWTGGDGSCQSDCNGFFDRIVRSPCAHLGGEQNNMAVEASIDTGCGVYSYKINDTPSPEPEPVDEMPQPSDVVCKSRVWTPPDDNVPKDTGGDELKEMDLTESKCFTDIDPKGVKLVIDDIGDHIPNLNNGHVVDSTMKNVTKFHKNTKAARSVTYMVNIGWIPGCTAFETMVADNPQGKSGDNPDQSISVTDILWKTFDQCEFPVFSMLPVPAIS